MRLISDGIKVDVSDGIGAVGHSLLGCLVSKSLQVSSLLGARPGDTKVWQACCTTHLGPCREIADVTCCFRGMSFVRCSLSVLDARDNAMHVPQIKLDWDRLIMTVSVCNLVKCISEAS